LFIHEFALASGGTRVQQFVAGCWSLRNLRTVAVFCSSQWQSTLPRI